MSQNVPLILNGGISTTYTRDVVVDELAPNNYLTIIWKDSEGNYTNTLDIDDKEAVEYTNSLNNAIDNSIRNNNISYLGQNKFINIEAIGKYLAQNNISAGAKRDVVNALIGIASGTGKKTPDNITNVCLNVFGTIADKTARKIGYTDPHEIFSQVAGENVLGVFKELGKQTQDWIDDTISKFSKKKKNSISNSSKEEVKYVGLLLGLTTSDSESMEITIPRKKVEDGSDYTTHLLPQPYKKDFSVILTNKILYPDYSQIKEIQNIEFTKNKLYEIANSHILFDIYIRLSNQQMYKRSNVYFSSLDITKDDTSGNGYRADFTIEPIGSFKTKTFISNKIFGNTGAGTGNNSKPPKEKTADGKYIDIYYADKQLKLERDTLESALARAKNKEDKYALKIIRHSGDPNAPVSYVWIPKDQVYTEKSGYLIDKADIMTIRSDTGIRNNILKQGATLNNVKGLGDKKGVTIDRTTTYNIVM